jgi:hypothetical protein
MIDDQKFGELIGTVNSIKENTDKIPDLATRLAEHEIRIAAMEPKVANHETIAQRSLTVAAIAGAFTGILSWIVRDSSH